MCPAADGQQFLVNVALDAPASPKPILPGDADFADVNAQVQQFTGR